MPPSILGDRLPLAAAAGQQDRLASIPESTVEGGFERVFQCRVFCRSQCNALHLSSLPLMRQLSKGELKKDAKSSDVCIRGVRHSNVPCLPGATRRHKECSASSVIPFFHLELALCHEKSR